MIVNNNYTLEELFFVGGSSQYLNFSIYNENGELVNLNGATCTWKLRQYGQYADNALLTKVGTVVSTGVFQIILNTADTSSLYGKFVQQISVFDFGGKQFNYQGIVTIEKYIS